MPSSGIYLPPSITDTSLLVSKIRRCIPRKWKGSASHIAKTEKASCSNINGAGSDFDISVSRDASLLESLLNAVRDCTSKNLVPEAFSVFFQLRRHVNSSSSLSSSPRCNIIVLPISCLLEACAANSLHYLQGLQLHGHVISLGVHQDPILLPRLVSFYSKSNLLHEACVILESSHTCNPLPWNVVMSAYIRNGHCKYALSMFRRMLTLGVKPDKFTYPTVLKACGEEGDLEFGMKIHRLIDAYSCEQNLFAQNALISMYGKCGEVELARQLFDGLPVRDKVSWNAIVSVYASMDKLDDAFILFERMQAEVSDINIIMWNTIAGCLLRTGNCRGALEVLSQMIGLGLHLDPIGTITGLTACTKLEASRIGKEIHASAFRHGCDEYHNVKNALITMYSSFKDIKHAYTVFQQVKDKSIITWNSMIAGYSNLERLDEASFLFREMLLCGAEPNDVTIASILPSFTRAADVQHGKEFHCYIIKRKKLNGCLLLCNALIDMYAKSGKILEARRIFDSLIERNKITFTSLISGYGSQGQGEIALELFQEMIKSGVKPDKITMVTLLTACSHSGLITQGQLLFKNMESDYGINPTLEHFSCMVDLYGRAGLLGKAKEVIRRMPYQSTPEMWATLLGACRNYGNREMGEWAAMKLLETEPEKSGYYLLTANMFASAGDWIKQATVRSFMKELGVRKSPGYASVDIGGIHESFLSGDASDQSVNDIYFLLEGLTEQIKDTGPVSSRTPVDLNIVEME